MKDQAVVITLSGVEVDLLDLDITVIPFYDINHSLSCIRRFFNQIQDYYSVAEHSLNAAILAKYLYPDKPHVIKAAFCHEFAEMLFGDMSSPLKYSAPLAGYMFLEKQAMKLFYMRFCGFSKQPKEVGIIDKMLLHWEAYYLNSKIFDKMHETSLLNTPDNPFTDVRQVTDILGKPECIPYEEMTVRFNNKFKELF